jgi:hypothetical protein
MADRYLIQLAARCYLEAGAPADAARCFLAGGEPRRALDIFVENRMFRQAADVWFQTGSAHHAAWLLADRMGEIPEARAVVEEYGAVFEPVDLDAVADLEERIAVVRRAKERAIDLQDFDRAAQQRDAEKQLLLRRRDLPGQIGIRLCWRLVQARCDAAEQVAAQRGLQVLGEAQRALAGVRAVETQPVEEWAVSVATAMRRLDQAALIFAASVRGRRPEAVKRWRAWSARALGEELVLPPGVQEGVDR